MHILKHLFILTLLANSHCFPTHRLAKMGRLIQCTVPALITSYGLFKGIKARDKNISELKELKHYSEPTPCVAQWAQEHVKNIPILVDNQKKASKISYRPPGIIVLHKDFAQDIHQALQKDRAQSPERDNTLAWAIFALRHEEGHHVYNDSSLTKSIIVILSAQLGAQAMMWKLPLPVLRSAKLLPQALFVAKNIAWGIAQYSIGDKVCLQYYIRFRERRADRFACKQITSPDILEGAANRLEIMNKAQLLDFLPEVYHEDGSLDTDRMLANFSTLSPSQQKWFTRFINFVSDPKSLYENSRKPKVV